MAAKRRSFTGADAYVLRGLNRAREGFAFVGRTAATITAHDADERCSAIGTRFSEAAAQLDLACNVLRRESGSSAKKFAKACEAAKRRQDRALVAGRRACKHRIW